MRPGERLDFSCAPETVAKERQVSKVSREAVLLSQNVFQGQESFLIQVSDLPAFAAHEVMMVTFFCGVISYFALAQVGLGYQAQFLQ